MSKNINYRGTYIERCAEGLKREEYLKNKSQHIDRHFDKEMYDLGTEWSLAGKKLEESKAANIKSFQNGYARGEKLKNVPEQ